LFLIKEIVNFVHKEVIAIKKTKSSLTPENPSP